MSVACRFGEGQQIHLRVFIESQNGKGWKGPKDHLVPSPCREQGHLPLDQVAQSSIQPGLEHCQGGGSHSFSGQPVPVFHHPHGEEFFANT